MLRATVRRCSLVGLGACGRGFSLAPGGSQSFVDVGPGVYSVSETGTSGWQVGSITCQDPSGGTTTNVGSGQVTINLAADEAVTCTFVNQPAQVLPATGAHDIDQLIRWGLVMVLVGAIVALRDRRSRIAIRGY